MTGSCTWFDSTVIHELKKYLTFKVWLENLSQIINQTKKVLKTNKHNLHHHSDGVRVVIFNFNFQVTLVWKNHFFFLSCLRFYKRGKHTQSKNKTKNILPLKQIGKMNSNKLDKSSKFKINSNFVKGINKWKWEKID